MNHIPTHCTHCGAGLHAHNLTGLCAECKLIARNERLFGQPAADTGTVCRDEALANVLRIFPAALDTQRPRAHV